MRIILVGKAEDPICRQKGCPFRKALFSGTRRVSHKECISCSYYGVDYLIPTSPGVWYDENADGWFTREYDEPVKFVEVDA